MYQYGTEQTPYSTIPIFQQWMTEAKIYTWKYTDKSMIYDGTSYYCRAAGSQMSDFMTRNFPSLPFLVF